MNQNHRSYVDLTRATFAALLLLGLGACASSPPEITYYLLRPPQVEGSGPAKAGVRAGIGRVVVAPYLQRTSGIQLETGEGELRPAALHQWAEALDAGMRWYIQSEVAKQLGDEVGGGLTDRQQWDYTIDIFVDRMHGTMDGRALLQGSFTIRGPAMPDGSRDAFQYRFSESVPLPEEGYAGAVKAQKALLSDFSGRIADALRTRIDRGMGSDEG